MTWRVRRMRNAGENLPDYIGRITEFFEGVDGRRYFACRWFFRPQDTVISNTKLFKDHTHDPKRVFLSDERNDNDLDCIVSKVKIIQVDPKLDQEAKAQVAADADLYFDMSYTVPYSTFENITLDINENSGISFDAEANSESDAAATKATILDLYSGCGGMSTGLCLGAVIAGLQIETRWAVDLNTNAWESFKYNHPITEVRNEKVEDFLLLLQEWSVLCDKYIHKHNDDASASPLKVGGEEHELGKGKLVIDKLTAICYGGAKREKCIYFKGDVDVLCGGPPCQGLSGNNRHRKCDKPLDDDKNRQIVTFMDIVSFLKPKYVLMENVADILKLNGGSVGRYALSRLVALNYQSRMGLMVAGCYGLPQFRMRMFLWGALPTMVLPKYPLPTHDVVVHGGAPSAFSVSNDETADETMYSVKAETEFQRYIRLSRKEMLDYSFGDNKGPSEGMLLDHRPLKLNKDDYERVKQIPHQKGANFRNLTGVKVGQDNVAYMDPTVKPPCLESGKPLVPYYALSFMHGKSLKPFGRLWWDETVPTVFTRAEPHNQIILHPDQARVLTVRENARLQGFPDYYRMYGPIKERYMQVGNAVAVPVARALGYALAQAFQRKTEGNNNLMIVLPGSFSDVAMMRVRARASSSGAEAAAKELEGASYLSSSGNN
ncbi:DNA (cytosine-5)-methyltransferase CMT3-like [Aegilops tauschii subsp. strangulata]|uniref:DNA (cytosine-5)-methyltransferase CMT3-like n=1 Tax=Aegilops tauschii subsp. strangulata TaxID=200361 RepID=UPI003CC88F74